jgi:anti-sigma B factor antagonist
LKNGQTKILLNLGGIIYMDSSGLCELVSGLRAVQAKGGDLKLLNLTKKINDLLQITRLNSVFDIHTDEAQAIASFHA